MTSLPPPPLLKRQAQADDRIENRKATIDDVANCYRVILRREMESQETGEGHLVGEPDLWTLIRKFLRSPETQLQKVFEASRFIQAAQDARNINLDLTESERVALTRHIESVWERYGREEAYFSVLTHPGYRADRITAANIEQFYETGAIELAAFRNICNRNGVEVDPNWSVCELGCGVARVGVSFARDFRTYLGVDISTGHLNLARDRLCKQQESGFDLKHLSGFMSEHDPYDLFYSVIVLQHNPPPVIHRLIDHSLRRLAPGGYAYFQLPCYLNGYSFDTRSYLSGAGQSDEMEMHALPQREVFSLLAKHGCTPIEVIPDGNIGPIGMSYAFFAQKRGMSA